ncbi:kinase-like domain-containing protein [Trametes polyzona]|nr:kinase-like domain-containing protein [Trametes polyzona]
MPDPAQASDLPQVPANWRELLPPAPKPEELEEDEVLWRDHQKWFEEHGYMLRPRYRPGWVASWLGTKHEFDDCEDGLTYFTSQIMDAKRVSDGEVVALKRIFKSINAYEVDLIKMFSAEPLATHPHNYCVPVYDVLESPLNDDIVFIVMPYLRLYRSPRFYTVGEAVECFRQLIEGLHFMHQQHVAHRDISRLNVMMDTKGLLSEPAHPHVDYLSYDVRRAVRFSTRTKHPTVPEFQHSDEPRDPFPTDVYYLGSLIDQDFLQKGSSLDFMKPLIADMIQDDPAKRPTMDEVVARYAKLVESLSTWKLRSRITHKKDSNIAGFYRSIRHVYRTAEYILSRRPAIPTPPS